MVSYLLKTMGKDVTYNDKLRFNYIIGKALIENSSVKLSDEDIKTLNSQKKIYNFVETQFKDVYYLDNENRWIDKITGSIINMNHYTGQVLEYKKALAYYALFQSCIIKRPFNLFHRKNLYIRTNNVERQFGNKTTWDKTFKHHFMNFVKEANNFVFDTGKKCKAINKSVFDIDGDFDLVYLDPPYLNKESTNETANYLKCYHFLEGLTRYEEWDMLIDFESVNLRLKKSNETDFDEENIYETYEKLIEKFQDSIIVLSYKKGGKPSIDYLIKLMKKFKSNVSTHTKHYYYALNGQNGNAKYNREVLIIGI
jgi:adenine-specific DNA-methyltransferase